MGTKAGNYMIQQQSVPPYQSVLFSTKEYFIYKTPDADTHDPKSNQYPELADIPDGNDTHRKGSQIRTN